MSIINDRAVAGKVVLIIAHLKSQSDELSKYIESGSRSGNL